MGQKCWKYKCESRFNTKYFDENNMEKSSTGIGMWRNFMNDFHIEYVTIFTPRNIITILHIISLYLEGGKNISTPIGFIHKVLLNELIIIFQTWKSRCSDFWLQWSAKIAEIRDCLENSNCMLLQNSHFCSGCSRWRWDRDDGLHIDNITDVQLICVLHNMVININIYFIKSNIFIFCFQSKWIG